MAKRTAVWVLFQVLSKIWRENGKKSLLVAEKSGTHTTDDDVDGDTERDQEASRNGMHASQVCHGSRTTQDQHRADDDVGCETGKQTQR